jgi:hypothetical protein
MEVGGYPEITARRDVKDRRESRLTGQKAAGTLKSTENPTDLSSRGKRRLGKIFGRTLGGHQNFLKGDRRRERPDQPVISFVLS